MKTGGFLIGLITTVNTSDYSLPKATYLVDLSLCDMQDRTLSF